jgi:CARDB
MRALPWKAVLLAPIALLVSVPAQAARPAGERLSVQPRAAMTMSKPDLVIQNVTYATPPKAGDQIGRTTIFNVQIQNAGDASAPQSRLKITCTPLGAMPCSPDLSGSLTVQPLAAKGQYGVAWPPMSQNKWAAGRYRLTFEADADHVVNERSETNNVRSLVVDVPGNLPVFSAAPGSKNVTLSKTGNAQVTTTIRNCLLQGMKITSPTQYSSFDLAGDLTVTWSSAADKDCDLAVNLQSMAERLTFQTKNTGTYTFKIPVTLHWSTDSYHYYTLWLSPKDKTSTQLAAVRIYLDKPTAIPAGACAGPASCAAFKNSWTDLKPTGFAVSYSTTPDLIRYQIRWKNLGPQCLGVVRWRIREGSRNIAEGSYIAAGASDTSFAVLGCQEKLIEGAVRKSDFTSFSSCAGASGKCSQAAFEIDYDNTVQETDESNNIEGMVFRWLDPWPK